MAAQRREWHRRGLQAHGSELIVRGPLADGRLERADIRRYPHLNRVADAVALPIEGTATPQSAGLGHKGEPSDDSDALTQDGLLSDSD